MPTYRNDTGRRITHKDKNYLCWMPGQVRACPFFVPHEDLGLTLIDEEPYVLRGNTRGFGYDEFIVKPGERVVYRIPYSETVEISVFSLHQMVRMYVGDCEIPIIVDPLNNHASRYPWDMCAYLTFEGAEKEAGVYVKVEPFTEKGE